MKMRNRKHQPWCRVVRFYEPGRCLMQYAVFYRGGRRIKGVSRYFSLAEHAYADAQKTIPSQGGQP